MNILEKLSTEEIAAHLRKPEGENGLEIANMMADHNAFMNHLTHENIAFQKNDTVLEMGIGNGFFLPIIQSKIEQGKLTGIDYSPTMIQEAIKLNQEFIQANDVRMLHSSIDNMPFETDYFSKILTVNTVYFWENVDTYLTEIKRVLQIGGKLAIGFRPKHIIEKIPFAQNGFNFYTMDDLVLLLEKHNFEIICQKTCTDERIPTLEASVIIGQKK